MDAIEVTVVSPTGGSFLFNALLSDTGDDTKTAVAALLFLPVRQIRVRFLSMFFICSRFLVGVMFSFSGNSTLHSIEGNHTLGWFGVRNGSTFRVFLRYRAAGFGKGLCLFVSIR